MTAESSHVPFWIGTYTTPAPHVSNASGAGILRGALDPQSGHVSVIPAADVPDPSYLALGLGRLFAVSETPGREGALYVFRIGPEGGLHLETTVSSGAGNPCHVTVVGEEVAVANYLGNRLQRFRRSSGSGGWERGAAERCAGRGPIKDRQEGPHLHQVVFLRDRREVAVCDLGIDRIWFHRVTQEGIEGRIAGSLATPPGCGPRHLVHSSATASLYVLAELSGEVLHYRWIAEELWELEARWPLAGRGSGELSGGAIKLHPEGNVLYASERSRSNLHAFHVDPTCGRLEPAAVVGTCGKTPRDFGIDPSGRWLLALNQDSNTIATYPLDPHSALPIDNARITPCNTPVCVVFPENGMR